jgi:hypothetical protein
MATQQPSKELRDWLDNLPEGTPWTADDTDPLIRKAVQHGFTTARPKTLLPLKSDTTTPKTTAG